MKKSTMAVVIVLILIAVGVAVAMTRDKETNDDSKTTNTSQTSTTTNTSQSTSTGSIEITKNRLFAPPQIVIAKGGTVTWTNNDSVAHTVTEDNGEGPDSGSIEPGATYSFTYNKAGSYQYHCKFHPEMRGTIVVK